MPSPRIREFVNYAKARLRIFSRRMGEKYEMRVRYHLGKVAYLLCSTVMMAAIGILLQVHGIVDLGILAYICFVVITLAMHVRDSENSIFYVKRIAYLYAVGFCTGQIVGPLVYDVLQLKAESIHTTIRATGFVFVSLSVAALLARNDSFLFLNSWLVNSLCCSSFFHFVNEFFRNSLMTMFLINVTVFLIAGYILYDIHKIISRSREGDDDAAKHALDLFIDLLGLARRIVIVSAAKELIANAESKWAWYGLI